MLTILLNVLIYLLYTTKDLHTYVGDCAFLHAGLIYFSIMSFINLNKILHTHTHLDRQRHRESDRQTDA